MESTKNKTLENPNYIPTPKEALEIQRELRLKVIKQNAFNEIKSIAGVDLAQVSNGKQLVCGIIVFSYPELEEIERVSTIVSEQFPYIPGLLAFREGPAIIETYKQIKKPPDLLMVDGHGIAHPRGIGIASHIGVILDRPSIGVAKKRLYGNYEEPRENQKSWTPLISKNGENIGAVLRTRKGTKPVFVSIGHKIDLKTSVKITLKCTKGYRIPDPTRKADKFVAELKNSSFV